MHVVFLILSVLFFYNAFDHLFITNNPRDRGMNGFLLAVSLNAAIHQASLLS